MRISRRELAGWLAASGMARGGSAAPQQPDASHIGNLYPFVQKLADNAPHELSFLRPELRDLKNWQRRARAKVFELLLYTPPPAAPQPELIAKTEREGYIEEYLSFQTGPDTRVRGYVLVPKNLKAPAPGVVVLHSHDGIYMWGKEKVIEGRDEHPWLTRFKQQRYAGRGIAADLARRGYVSIAIDMFYWGERRMLLDDDPPGWRERARTMTEEEIQNFNRRASQNESLVARSLLTAGASWPGVLVWDDIRALDYLASRPEVDKRRLASVGLSVGGFRSFMLAALDERIKAAVDVGWMTSFGLSIKRHVINSMGLTFVPAGLYRHLDLPDLAAAVAPRALLVINGSQDRLFAPDGVKAAFEKIARCYAKAGAAERQRCSLYDAPHEFNAAMQAEAWKWLERWV